MLACFLTKPSRIIRERKLGNQVLQESGRMDRTPSSRPGMDRTLSTRPGTDRSHLVNERCIQATRSKHISLPRANRSDPLVRTEPSDPFNHELVFSDPNRTDLATRVPNRHLDQFSPSARSDFQADHDTCPQRLI